MTISCTADYEATVNRAIERHGFRVADEQLLERAKSGDGRDAFVYYRFLRKMRSQHPELYSSDETMIAFVNCSALAGYWDGLNSGFVILAASTGERERMVATCLSARPLSRANWLACGAEKLLPSCPLDP